ncbi:MAG: hypothetical protein JWR11_1029 [Mycobacterium sp.]|nr:hypothetical protein [Mycobacterium sp.]MDT5178023.1 hypothetical protein [Mycobacterium sp.]
MLASAPATSGTGMGGSTGAATSGLELDTGDGNPRPAANQLWVGSPKRRAALSWNTPRSQSSSMPSSVVSTCIAST